MAVVGGRAGRPGAISVTRCNGADLVLLVGDVGAREAVSLRQRLVLDGGSRDVVVDASAATWLGDDVIEVLVEVAATVTGWGGAAVVVDPPTGAVGPLRRCGMTVRRGQAARGA